MTGNRNMAFNFYTNPLFVVLGQALAMLLAGRVGHRLVGAPALAAPAEGSPPQCPGPLSLREPLDLRPVERLSGTFPAPAWDVAYATVA